MARPGAERDWTDCARKHDWPLRKRAEGRTCGSGPDLPDWPTEQQLAAAEERAS